MAGAAVLAVATTATLTTAGDVTTPPMIAGETEEDTEASLGDAVEAATI